MSLGFFFPKHVNVCLSINSFYLFLSARVCKLYTILYLTMKIGNLRKHIVLHIIPAWTFCMRAMRILLLEVTFAVLSWMGGTFM